MTNVKYRLLDDAMFPRFVQAFREFYRETEGGDMPQIFTSNWMMLTIAGMKNPGNLYLLATIGKKIVGFTIVNPLPALDGVQSAMADPLYVIPEYRGKSDAAVMLYKTAVAWLQKTGYRRVFTYENPEDNTWSRKEHMGFKPYKKILVKEILCQSPGL